MDLLAPTTHLGEVIESSTTQFVAQCCRLNDPPAFGSFVRIAPPAAAGAADDDPFAAPALPEGAIYALVYEAETASIEPNRRPAAYGLEEERLRAEQPQIFELLATSFSALIVGHTDGGAMRTYLPPKPPRIHALVEECTASEVCALTERLDYLRAICALPGFGASDELIAASLREAYRRRHNDYAFLVRAGKEVAMLLRDDYDRLSAVLHKLTPYNSTI